jgi:hypothetical protein
MHRLRSLFIGALLIGVLASIAHGQTRGGFDADGRLLMHGVPRFVLGVYDSGGSYSSDPALWEQQLFSPTGSRGLQGIPLNVYLNYWLGGMPIAPTNALLDVLHDHGMMYLQTGNCFDTGSWTRYGPGSFSIMSQTYVQQYAQHPAALGYYIMDECVDALIPETEQHQQQLKAWDPQGVTFAANLAAGYRDPSLWIDAADVMGTDPYPLYGPEPAAGYTHFIVGDFVSKLRAVSRPDRPVWSVLQFFKFTSDSRMPTADELRAHAVMSVVEGAQGIFWWDIGSNGLRKQDAATVATYMGHLRTLTTELAGLEPALLADEANAALVGNSTRFANPVTGRIAQLQHNIAVEWLYSRKQWYQEELAALQAGDTSKSGGLLNRAADVRTLTKVLNGVGYVFAYNYTNASRPVTFTWQQVPTGVRESKTGQTFSLSGASWNDTLGPYQSRIYIISGAGNPPAGGGGEELALSFTNPSAGATVSGTATVTVAATGGTGYTFSIAVDGTTVYSGANPSFSWNTTTVSDGAHTLTATVTDSQSRVAAASRAVTVQNGQPPPAGFTVSFSHPASGALVSGAQGVGLSTTATWGQSKTFTLSVDGTVITSQTVTGTTLWHTWNTTATPNGARTLTATVSMNGDTATATLPVTVNNGGSPLPLTAAFTAPAPGAILNGTATIGMASTGATGSSTFSLAVDGIVVSTQTVSGASATYAWNTRTVSTGAHTLTLTVTDAAWRVATATVAVTVVKKTPRDFDGDAKADILWRHTAGNLAQWRLNGSSVTAVGLGTVSTDWTVAGVGDFNGDGKADILWRHTSGSLAVWLLDGSSVITTGTLQPVAADWTVAGIADFNGDGKSDVLWRQTSGSAAVWLLDGTHLTAASVIGSLSPTWTVAGVGDFNGDGRADILWRHTSGLVFEWLMNGMSLLGTVSLGTVTADWAVAGTGDFNNDGKADILWRHSTGAMHQWLMSASSVGSSAWLGTVTSGWAIAGVGDYNGDGKADIVWRHTSGDVSLWLLDGPSIIGTGLPGGAATSWRIQ